MRLPGRGAEFSAVAGVDSNEQTSGGRGSVHFSVEVGGQERFKSALLREGMVGVPVQVALGGAGEFTLVVDDGGDGISCDQADWAEARVTLDGGRQVWLADMPLVEGGVGKPLSADPPFAFTYDGKRSADLLPAWTAVRSSRNLDERRVEHIVVYSDKATGLEARCVASSIAIFRPSNGRCTSRIWGQAETPILSDILAFDLGLDGRAEASLFCTISGAARAWPVTSNRSRLCCSPGPSSASRRQAGVRQTVTCPISTSRGRTPASSWSWAGPDNGPRSLPVTRPQACESQPARRRPPPASSGRGGPHAADGAAVLARRLDSRPEPWRRWMIEHTCRVRAASSRPFRWLRARTSSVR